MDAFSLAGMQLTDPAVAFLGAVVSAVLSSSLAAAWGSLFGSLVAFVLTACAFHCFLQLTGRPDPRGKAESDLSQMVAELKEGVKLLQGSVLETKESACGVAEANARLGAALASLEAVSREGAALKEENSRLMASVEALTRDLGDLKATNARLEAGFQELESVSRENADLVREAEELKAELAKMEADVADMDAVLYENSDLKSENSRLEATLRELDSVAADNAALIADNARLKGELQGLDGLAEENEELKATLAEKVRLFKEYFDLRRTMDQKTNAPALKKIAELEAVVKAQRREIQELKGEVRPGSLDEEEEEDGSEEEGSEETESVTDSEAETEAEGEAAEDSGVAGSAGLASAASEGAKIVALSTPAPEAAPKKKESSTATAAAVPVASPLPAAASTATTSTTAAAAASPDPLRRLDDGENASPPPSEAGTSPVLRPIDTGNTSESADRNSSQDSDLTLAPAPTPTPNLALTHKAEAPRTLKQEELERRIAKAFDMGSPTPLMGKAAAMGGVGSGAESDGYGAESCSLPVSRALSRRRGLGGWLRTR